MTARLMSRNGVLTLTIVIAAGICLALLGAIVTQGLSLRTITASLLVLCFVVFLFGGVLFAGRAFLNWQIAETPSYLIWERGFVIVAILITVLGLFLLEDMLRANGDFLMARVGMLAFGVAATVAVVAETTCLSKRDWIYSQIVMYVILAFLAQAAFGIALLQSDLVAGWVAWATILWNLVWLIVLLIFNPRNIYFPALHHAAPLLIGIALLVQ